MESRVFVSEYQSLHHSSTGLIERGRLIASCETDCEDNSTHAAGCRKTSCSAQFTTMGMRPKRNLICLHLHSFEMVCKACKHLCAVEICLGWHVTYFKRLMLITVRISLRLSWHIHEFLGFFFHNLCPEFYQALDSTVRQPHVIVKDEMIRCVGLDMWYVKGSSLFQARTADCVAQSLLQLCLPENVLNEANNGRSNNIV